MVVKRPKKLSGLIQPKSCEATRGTEGRVIRGTELTREQAIARRMAGLDIVVCDGGHGSNRRLAKEIESAVGPYKREDPHRAAGQHALPHYQPQRRPPDGHSFYETSNRKAAKNP